MDSGRDTTGRKELAMGDGFEKDADHGSGGGFVLGLLAGTVLGAGLGMLLAPKSGSELRSQIGDHAASLGRVAGEQFRRAGEAAGSLGERTRAHAPAAAIAADAPVTGTAANASEGDPS